MVGPAPIPTARKRADGVCRCRPEQSCIDLLVGVGGLSIVTAGTMAASTTTSLIIGATSGGAVLVAIVAGLSIFCLLKRRRAQELPLSDAGLPVDVADSKIASRTHSTEMTSARDHYESVRVTDNHYAQHGDEFRAGLPRGSIYSQMPPGEERARPNSHYMSSATEFGAGLPQGSNYAGLPKETGGTEAKPELE